MELKWCTVYFPKCHLLAFNRTAYGIEIPMLSSPYPSLLSFNRTAYGIEIYL